jgi:predicted TIM-barrel fold metal-dependent hydrolase
MNVHAPASTTSADDVLAGIKIIDVDTHLTEPPNLWTSRAPARYRDRVPQIRRLNGTPTWTIDNDTSLGMCCSASAIGVNGDKARDTSFAGWMIEEVHRGAWNTKARVEYMDETGVWAQIVYPNVLGFAGQAAAKVDPELRLISTQIYNDAGAEMQAESNDRLFPMALLPWWDIKLAVAEAERCADMGMRGVNINSDPDRHGMQDLSGDYWSPLWELCSDRNLPVNFHIGSSDTSMSWHGDAPWPSLSPDLRVAIGSTMLFLGNARVVANLIYSGLLEKFPKLKFVSVESGVGWIPFLLETLDYEILEAAKPSMSKFSMKPSDYFRRQIFGCWWFERDNLAAVARQVGLDNIMFETDFPHPTCLYPDPLSYAIEALAPLSAQDKFKLMSGNASRVYNIPVPVPPSAALAD